MSTQLLIRYDNFDRAAFDTDAEARGQAGLTLLQLWRENATSYWALFSVNDGKKAKAWLDKERGLGHGPATAHMLETA